MTAASARTSDPVDAPVLVGLILDVLFDIVLVTDALVGILQGCGPSGA